MAAQARQPRLRDGAATRAKIEREALRLFAEKGVEGATIRDLSQAVGVADAALYRYFGSKEQIASDLFRTHYGRLRRKSQPSASATIPSCRRRGSLSHCSALFSMRSQMCSPSFC